jgi:hypothetical protein
MLYILHGRDDFSRREELSRIKAARDSDGMLSSNTDVLDGRVVTLEQLTGICDTVPFLAGQRLVVVEGLLGRFEVSDRSRRGGARPKRGPAPELERWLAMAEYVLRLPASTTLVLIDDGFGETASPGAAGPGEVSVPTAEPCLCERAPFLGGCCCWPRVVRL